MKVRELQVFKVDQQKFYKLLALTSSLMVIVSTFEQSQASASAKPLNDYGFVFTVKGNIATIVGCKAACPKKIVIPATIGDGKKVVSIGTRAFAYGTSDSLVLPDSLVSIGSRAFMHNTLRSVTFGVGLKSIDFAAFYYNNLKSVNFGPSLESIGIGAFQANFLTNVTFPKTVSNVGIFAFAENQLNSTTFLGDAPKVGKGALNWEVRQNDMGTDVVGTEVVYAPETAQGWDSTWSGVPVQKVASASFLKYKTTSKKVTISGCVGTCPARLLVPESIGGNPVTAIGSRAFENGGLTYLPLPKSISSVGDSAFKGDVLTDLHFLGNAPTIGKDAFSSMSESANVRLAWDSAGWGDTWSGKSVTVDASPFNEADWGQNGLQLVGCRGRCDGLDLVIPASIHGKPVLSLFAFWRQRLESVQIPNSVIHLETECFSGNNLTRVVLPSSLTLIDEGAFTDNQLESVTIPSSVTNIGDYAFQSNKLETVVFLGNAPQISGSQSSIFYGNPKLKEIKISKNSTGWSKTWGDQKVVVTK